MFEEEIIVSTAANDLEFISEDDIFENGLYVPFSKHLVPHHDEGIIQDVLHGAKLHNVLHDF